MCSAFGGVVPMCAEMTVHIALVTYDDVPFDSRGIELKRFAKLGKETVPDVSHGGSAQAGIGDRFVASDLVAGVMNLSRATIDIAHEAGRLATPTFVEFDQSAAKIRLKNARYDKNGSVCLDRRSAP